VRIHVIQHATFEDAGLIREWAAERGHDLTSGLALTEEFPPSGQIDFLVVMGGPMGADDEVASPWLHAEKRYIAEAIASGRLVLGVCLGSQIIAEVLGGKIRRNAQREIGWYTVERTPRGDEEPLIAGWTDPLVVGQWHGDTFDLPDGIEPVLTSEACANQAFVFDRRVVGVQFHLEWTEALLGGLIAECGDDCEDTGMWVMSCTQVADEAPERIAACRTLLFTLLDAMDAEGAGFAGETA
jgi:GMP synthase-like glutamine amidotransferase